MSSKTNKFHIGLDSVGYMLTGTPKEPGRRMDRSEVFGNRFASGDRDYTDFSIWWFWAQTDWSGGFKDDIAWEDDAKFYYSTNIDAFSEIGGFKLAGTLTETEDFTDNISAATNGTTNDLDYSYIGTEGDAVSSKVEVWRSSNESDWTDVSSASFPAAHNLVPAMIVKDNYLWVLQLGTASTWTISYFDGNTTWYDATADAKTGASITNNITAATAATAIGIDLYIACDGGLNSEWAIIKTSDPDPTTTGEWSKITGALEDKRIVALENYGGNLYYLLYSSPVVELRKYDLTNSIDILVETFKGVSYNNELSDRYLHSKFGKLIVTIPNSEIWSYDGSDLERIYKIDSAKNTIGNEAKAGSLSKGGQISGDKIYWSNLIYDGTNFYNWIKRSDDATTTNFIPILVNESGTIFGCQSDVSALARSKLYSYSGYKSTADKNFLVFNEFQDVSTIDKLANTIKIIYKPFDIGESIKVSYSIDGGANYTLLGTASYALDGASKTQKKFEFSGSIVFQKMMIKVDLDGDGSSTPTFLDYSLQYVPVPDYKYQWFLNIKANDLINDMSNKVRVSDKGVDIRSKLRASFLGQAVVDYEDVDYGETLLNGSLTAANATVTVDSTDDLPESGRIKIEQEEIFYTGKTSKTFTGCTRGYRGTEAVTHADNTVVSNKYRVLMTDFSETNPVLNDDEASDYTINIRLIET